jgi:hypothetical protein
MALDVGFAASRTLDVARVFVLAKNTPRNSRPKCFGEWMNCIALSAVVFFLRADIGILILRGATITPLPVISRVLYVKHGRISRLPVMKSGDTALTT